MATFAERLLLLREEKHVSQSVAANASGINLRTITAMRMANGSLRQHADPHGGLFGVTIDYLVGRSDAR